MFDVSISLNRSHHQHTQHNQICYNNFWSFHNAMTSLSKWKSIHISLASWFCCRVVVALHRCIDMLYICEYKVPTYWANCWLEINGNGAPATQQAICMAGLQTLPRSKYNNENWQNEILLIFRHEGEEIFHCEVLFRRDSVPTTLDGCWFFAIRFNTTTAATAENGELCARGVRRFG